MENARKMAKTGVYAPVFVSIKNLRSIEEYALPLTELQGSLNAHQEWPAMLFLEIKGWCAALDAKLKLQQSYSFMCPMQVAESLFIFPSLWQMPRTVSTIQMGAAEMSASMRFHVSKGNLPASASSIQSDRCSCPSDINPCTTIRLSFCLNVIHRLAE